jgi:hypothetical protein
VEAAEILDLDLELAEAPLGDVRGSPGRDDAGVARADVDDGRRQAAALGLIEAVRGRRRAGAAPVRPGARRWR